MRRAVTFLIGATLSAQYALAQTQPAGQAEISVPQKSTLSGKDMLAQIRDYRGRVQGVLLRIQSLQEQARKQKDIIRLNCLADKLVQAKVNLNIVDQAIVAVQEAVNRKDDSAALHEFTRVTIIHQKAQVLGAEAEACVGEDLSFVGATKVEVEEPKNLPPTDLTPPLEPPPVERPPPASPST